MSLTSRRTVMARKRYKPEEIVAKLRQVDVLVSQGHNMVDAIRQIGVSEVTYYRWRQEFGGLKTEQVKRLKDLELENSRLRKAMLLTATNTFWPSVRTPMTTSSEIAVALRSSRTSTTVPSRMSRTIGSAASERAFQASQSAFTLRQTRLTVSLPTAPPNSAFKARRTRRVLVPAK